MRKLLKRLNSWYLKNPVELTRWQRKLAIEFIIDNLIPEVKKENG